MYSLSLDFRKLIINTITSEKVKIWLREPNTAKEINEHNSKVLKLY